MENNHIETSSFWKQHSRAVPGRPSPKKDISRGMAGRGVRNQLGATSFEDYQESVSDAWNAGDDEYCIISAGVADTTKISRRVSHNAAIDVIKTHKSNKQHKVVASSGNTANCSTTNSNINEATQPVTVQLGTDVDEEEKKNCEGMENVNIQEDEVVKERRSSGKYKQFHAYPGRPQLQKFNAAANQRDAEYECKIEKFQNLLEAPLLNLVALKELSWPGIPRKMRAITWRLLAGYLPTSLERRNSVLERKRLDYHNLVAQYFKVDSIDDTQQETYRQIHIDVPRMNPHVPLFQQQLVQEIFERILFIWAIRHPASGYVQGINDLVTPFFIVFLQEVLVVGRDLEVYRMDELDLDQRNIIEADAFWCLSKFLDCIQDNYIFAQLGIQAKVNQLKELIQRIDGVLHNHLTIHGVDYLQFSFRWMNNLLTRELPLHCTIRLWDTYLAESDGFAVFQLYVCAAFLLQWRDQLLQQTDFQGLMLMLQNLPTHNWSDSHISVLVAEAYRLKFTYADAPKHLEAKS